MMLVVARLEGHYGTNYPQTPTAEVQVMANGDLPASSQTPGPAGLGPVRPGPQPMERQRRFEVNIAAYVQMSFQEEVELSGHIGDLAFAASSHASTGRLKVAGAVGPDSVNLRVRMKRIRSMSVSGEVLGQPISGNVTTTSTSLTFQGMAGQEPLHYQLDAKGSCASHNADLGLHLVYQAYYSEIVGTVDRIPDGAMVGLLLPVALVKWEAAYS
ncbi:MAG: hypothetical protein GY773_09815 [Actinomycetia bacterium]|nr:hypothetical protein [Actinomycetes bacterium]